MWEIRRSEGKIREDDDASRMQNASVNKRLLRAVAVVGTERGRLSKFEQNEHRKVAFPSLLLLPSLHVTARPKRKDRSFVRFVLCQASQPAAESYERGKKKEEEERGKKST